MELPALEAATNIPDDVSRLIALAALFVSIFSYTISKRNIFGPKPIIRIASVTINYTSSDSHVSVVVNFEIWNLRKAPILVRYNRIFLASHHMPDDLMHTPGLDGWFFLPDPPRALYQQDHTVRPLEIESFIVSVPINRPPKYAQRESFKFCATLFDGTNSKEYDITKHYSLSWDYAIRQDWRKKLRYELWKMAQYIRLYLRY